jgi:hypothetical protein
MKATSNTIGNSVSGEIVQSAAAGVEDAWDAIVDAYAGLVWAVAQRGCVNTLTAAEVSRITWMRFQDRLGAIPPEAIGGWLTRTAEREGIRLARLSRIGGDFRLRSV